MCKTEHMQFSSKNFNTILKQAALQVKNYRLLIS